MTCATKLSEFDIIFKLGTSIKGHALVNFVAKFTNVHKIEMIMELVEAPGFGVSSSMAQLEIQAL